MDEISDPIKNFDLRNIFFFFNKPLQKLGSIFGFVSLYPQRIAKQAIVLLSENQWNERRTFLQILKVNTPKVVVHIHYSSNVDFLAQKFK